MTGKMIGAAAENPGKKTRKLVVIVPLLTVILSACATEKPGEGNPQSMAAESTTQPPSSTASAGNGSRTPGFKTPAAAVKSFVTHVLQERYKEACLAGVPQEMREKKAGQRCNTPQATKTFASLHDAWAKPGVKLPPEAKVEVGDITKDGDTARVSDSAITLDGRTLRELELIGSSGNTQSFKLSIKLRKSAEIWYISDLAISF